MRVERVLDRLARAMSRLVSGHLLGFATLAAVAVATVVLLAPVEALWSKNLAVNGSVSMATATPTSTPTPADTPTPTPTPTPTCTLGITQNATVESGGNTTYSYTLTGGKAEGCQDISYVALPVCFNPNLTTAGGLVLSETHPSPWTYTPQNGGPFGKRVKWNGNTAGTGPFNAIFRFTLAGTGIPTVEVQAQTHAGSGNDPVDSGLVSVPQPASCQGDGQ